MTTFGVTGHQGLPGPVAAFVESRLTALLSAATDLVGLSSLAEGADQMFAELILRFGGELRVVLPSRDYERTFDAEGLSTFLRLKSAAADVQVLGNPKATEAAFFEAGREVVDRCDVLCAVWDGEPARGLGGTADVVAYARGAHKPVEVIWPAGAVR